MEAYVQTNLKLRPKYRAGLENLQTHHRKVTNPAMSFTFIVEQLIEKECKRMKMPLGEKRLIEVKDAV